MMIKLGELFLLFTFVFSSLSPKESRQVHLLNPKIIPCIFHVPRVILGYQIFGVTVFIISM